jgi:hypothetical protein
MDVHIRRSITLGLRKSGVDVITAQEDRAAELTDFDWSGSPRSGAHGRSAQ